MSHFHSEIREQPSVLAGLLDQEAIAGAADALRGRAPSFIATLARGSSNNSARFFTYLAGTSLRLPAAALPLSMYSVHGTAPLADNVLAVGVSQSGRSEDVIKALTAFRSAGAATVGVSNDPASGLAAAAEWHLAQQAGVEKAVAATKTMSSQMFALALLVAHWSGDAGLLAALQQVPAAVQQLLEAPPAALKAAAASLEQARSVWLLGRGVNQAVAEETGLKLKETNYLDTHSYSAAEVLHGPVAALETGARAVMFALSDASADSNLKTARRFKELGASLTVIGSQPEMLQLADFAVELPALPPAAESFVQLAAGQLLVEELTGLRGLDPDQPRHLSKVTVTV